MKKVKLLLVLLGVFHLVAESQIFEIKIDTINVSISDKVRPASRICLSHAVKYYNKYYCFYEQNGLYNFSRRDKLFFVLSEDGIIEDNIKVPKEIDRTRYFDLFIRNDSIFAKTYMDHDSFYFDLDKLEWKKVKEVDDMIYEDDKFYVTYLDFGEWGSTTWFKDKRTGIEYEFASSGEIVNRIGDTYYITDSNSIMIVKDPLKLKECKPNNYYGIVKQSAKHIEGTSSLMGVEILYQSPTDIAFHSYKNWIATSFIHNNELLHLCVDSCSTYIAKLDKCKLKPIHNLGKAYSIFDWFYSYRGGIQKNGTQLLKFNTDDINLSGLMEIDKKDINICYLKHDIDSVSYMGNENANCGFKNVLNYIKSNIYNLELNKIDSIERINDGVDLKLFRKGAIHESFYANKKKFHFEGSKKYLRVEDSILTNYVQYYYTKNDSLIKTIFFEWFDTVKHKRDNSFFNDNINSKEKAARFQQKLIDIESCITEIIGSPVKRKDRSDNSENLIWESSNGMTVSLSSSDFKKYREIRMVIYGD